MENLILEYTKDYSNDNTLSKKIVKDMLKNLHESHKSSKRMLREDKIDRFSSEFSMTSIMSEPLFNSKYVCKDVKKYMDVYFNYTITYSFNVDDRDIIVIFYVKDTNKKIFDLCDIKIRKIITILFFLSKYSSGNCSKQLKIHLPLTPLRKCLPRSNLDILDTVNVNSAVTTSCTTNGVLIIYRLEEWFKILIHELFHVMGLDFSLIHSDICSKKLREELNIDSELLIYEAYAEFWATIINSLCFTYFTLYLETDVTKIGFNEFYNINKLNMNIETTFSLIQVIKVLSHMHLTYEQLWSKDHKYKKMRNMMYKENTNVFAYYILKCSMLVNKDDIFNWCMRNNTNILNFNDKSDKIVMFCDELIKISREKHMYESIEYGERILKEILKKNLRKEVMDKILHSSRMTLLTV